MDIDFNLLNLNTIIWLPVITGLIMLFFNNKYIKNSYYLAITVNFILILLLYRQFDVSQDAWQFVKQYSLYPEIGIIYSLGVDGISLALIILIGLINLLLGVCATITQQNNNIYANILIVYGLVNGVLTATNALFFYIFFDLILIPLFFMIGVSGKFVSRNLFGSVLFLMLLIYLYQLSANAGVDASQWLDLGSIHRLPLTLQQQMWIFIVGLFAIAGRMGLAPWHNWWLNINVTVNAVSSIVLTSITLILGVLVMLRFLLPLTVGAWELLDQPVMYIALSSILYVSLAVIMQKNFRALINYVSMVYISLTMIGLFVTITLAKQHATDLANLSLLGAVIHILAHGLIISGLLLLAKVLYARVGSCRIDDQYRLIANMPIFAKILLGVCLASIALPGTVGFIGKLFIIFAGFKCYQTITILISGSLVIVAGYMMWSCKNILFGKVLSGNSIAVDLAAREKISLMLLGGIIIWLGMYPKPVIRLVGNATADLVAVIQARN